MRDLAVKSVSWGEMSGPWIEDFYMEYQWGPRFIKWALEKQELQWIAVDAMLRISVLKSLWLTRSITRIYFPFDTDAASLNTGHGQTWTLYRAQTTIEPPASFWGSLCSTNLRTFLPCSVFVSQPCIHIMVISLTVVINKVAGETNACYLPAQTVKIKDLLPATLAWRWNWVQWMGDCFNTNGQGICTF